MQFEPQIIHAGQPFTVSITGINISVFETVQFPDKRTYEVDVNGNDILLTSVGPASCFSPVFPLLPNTRPQIRTYSIPGLPAGNYNFRIDHDLGCESYSVQEERSLTIYEAEESTLHVNLEAPVEGQVVSGVGLIRGWACHVKQNGQFFEGPMIGRISFQVDDWPMTNLAYPTSRKDAESVCGEANSESGFGAVVYWGDFGVGPHEITLYVDGAPHVTHSFTVVQPAEGFLTDLEALYELPSFPSQGRDVRIEWSQSDQNFIIVEFD